MSMAELSRSLTALQGGMQAVITQVDPLPTAPTMFLGNNPRRFGFICWCDETEPNFRIAPGNPPIGFFMKPNLGTNWFVFTIRDLPGLIGQEWYYAYNNLSTMYVCEMWPLE